MRSYTICDSLKILLGLSDQGMISPTRRVASMEASRNDRILVPKFEGELYLVDLGVDVRIILKFISERNFHMQYNNSSPVAVQKFKRRHDYPTVHISVRSLTICILHQILLGDKIKEMDREFDTRVGEDKFLLGLVDKPEGKRTLGRRRRKGEDTIKMCPKGTG